eukprot:TRINITY_DN352_c1_g1_i10.p1 TRINITY_DN352_c1_g1~~TRINITY_DN352_c1_g1_i10.p1  ORF type:complete len:468 (-),score=92.69 TRINITY_DN352_c1_g1_i10:369-1772(-)
MATGGSLEGVGAFILHGFTPALDLASEFPAIVSHQEGSDSAGQDSVGQDSEGAQNYLIASAGDIRHILKTIAWQHRHGASDLHFYVHETHPEGLARQLLLLAVVLDKEMSVMDAMEMFLDIYGNAKTRERTAEYITTKVKELIDFVIDGEGPMTEHVDLSLLKHKERDQLEEVLRSYLPSAEFDMDKCRDERLRKYYAARYDARENLIDWDKSMKLAPLCSIIHSIHFKDWRLTGQAFRFRDNVYNISNRTLSTRLGAKVQGRELQQRGYWGDIVNSPYYAFGIESEELSLFTKRSDQHVKGSNHVSEYNVASFIHELRYGGRFALPKPDQVEGVDPTVQGREEEDAQAVRARCRFKLHFLSPTPKVSDVVLGRKRYSHLFHGVYLSSTALPAVTSDLKDCLVQGVTVPAIVEKVSFILDLSDEQKTGFATRAQEIMHEGGWKAVETPLQERHYLSFAYPRTAGEAE